ncbi:MAG: glycosyltransferase [Bacteroidia bacterium]|nr:glycosyltransferase [Bacteroidia bacterium]
MDRKKVQNLDMNNPLVSIIIPVYNGENFIAEAVQCVLNQDYYPLEVIVVDDGSTDRSGNIIAQFGNQVNYIFQENAGPANARNKGLAAATGQFIGFLDADDLWPENRIREALSVLSQHPDLGFVQGFTKQVFSQGKTIKSDKREETIFGFVMGSALFRRFVFETVGSFDDSMKFCEDLDWFIRAMEFGIPFKIQEKVTLVYRIHDKNFTRDNNQTKLYPFIAFKKSLDRQRTTGDGMVKKFLNILNSPQVKDFLASVNNPPNYEQS